MTREDFGKIIKGLKAVYADPKFIADQDAFDVWYGLLGDLDYQTAAMATQAYMQSSPYEPKPADIRKYATQIHQPTDMSELEAWGLVRKAISNSLYHSQEEFDRLPALIRQTIGNHEQLREMAQLDMAELNTVEQSHFVRNYRAKREAVKGEAQLQSTLRDSIGRLRGEIIEQLRIADSFK